MRLAEYPFVIVRIGCSRCARRGQYRLARLAERYGADITLPYLLEHLASDCTQRDVRHRVYDYCGAFFPDLSGSRPPDMPTPAARIRIVK